MVGSGRRVLLAGSLVAAAALTTACTAAAPATQAPSGTAAATGATAPRAPGSSSTDAAATNATATDGTATDATATDATATDGTATDGTTTTAAATTDGPPPAASTPTGSAAVVPATPAITAPSARPAPSAASPAVARGPVPLAWERGTSVLYAPFWQPTRTTTRPWLAAWPRPVRFLPTRSGPLSGQVIALDPGHDIGNATHVSLINKSYWVGFSKACNTTGTATNRGYAEATYAFDVAARLRRLLTAAGATVVVTRDRNTTSTYGPCIGARGLFGGQQKARLMVQIHADGGPSTGHGFHTIVPASSSLGSTRLTAAQDKVLAAAIIAGMRSRGFAPATYLSSPLQVRADQGAMTVSTVPITTVETLNMRNASDAAIAMSPTGRQRVAQGLYAGILRYLGR